jgi:hypothetical protein
VSPCAPFPVCSFGLVLLWTCVSPRESVRTEFGRLPSICAGSCEPSLNDQMLGFANKAARGLWAPICTLPNECCVSPRISCRESHFSGHVVCPRASHLWAPICTLPNECCVSPRVSCRESHFSGHVVCPRASHVPARLTGHP